MKKLEKLFAQIICLALIGVMILGAVPLGTSAAQTAKLVPCIAMDSEGNGKGAGAGIPLMVGENTCVFSHQGLFGGEDLTYIAVFGEKDYREMSNVLAEMGISMWVVSDLKESECFKWGVPTIGEEYNTLFLLTDETTISGKTVFTGYDSESNEAFFELTGECDFPEFPEKIRHLPPAAILNEKNEVVALLVVYNEKIKFYSLEEPVDGESKPGQKAQPTRPTRGSESGEEKADPTTPTIPTTPDPKPSPKPNNSLIYIVAGAVVVAAVLFLLLRKKTASAGNKQGMDGNGTVPRENYPATKPVDEKKENLGGWEAVPEEKSPISIALVGAGGAMNGRVYRVGASSVLIGRAENADIRYPAETKGVSRRHCQVLWKNGVLMVMDLGSTAGTYLNGKNKLPANTPVPVTEGDVIYLGSKENGLRIETR